MKIKATTTKALAFVALDQLASGTTVRFEAAFHSNHKHDDLFIVLRVCNSYVPECVKRSEQYPFDYDKYASARGNRYAGPGLHPHDYDDFGKVGLVNLRTGTLCYVNDKNSCIVVDAEVLDHGDKR
jgi:hypothetical protein